TTAPSRFAASCRPARSSAWSPWTNPCWNSCGPARSPRRTPSPAPTTSTRCAANSACRLPREPLASFDRPPRNTAMPKIDELLLRMPEAEASDLHIVVDQKPKYRVHGEVKLIEDWPVLDQQAVGELLFAIINDEQRERYLSHRDFDF